MCNNISRLTPSILSNINFVTSKLQLLHEKVNLFFSPIDLIKKLWR